MEGWKADQLNQLIEKTTHTNNPIADTDEVLWTELEQVFKDSFTNTNVKNDAFMMLQHLTQKDSLDLYISEFKQLTNIMGVNRDDHRILELFKKGLKNGLLISIIRLPTFDPNTPWNFAQWEEAAQKQHNKWKVQQQYKKGNEIKC